MLKSTDVDEIDKILYNNYSSYLDSTRDRTNYSIRRIDLLIISLSGGGIYVVFEILRFFKLHPELQTSMFMLKVSGVVLFLAIMINFVSQMTGYRANNCEERFINERLKELRSDKKFDQDLKNRMDRISQYCTRWTTRLNYASISTMVVGFILLLIFNLSYL